MNQHTFFPLVQDFYSDLVDRLTGASERISMTYLAFEDGNWAHRILQVLREKAEAGVQVRMMVDEIGQQLDEPRNLLRNHEILRSLRQAGVQVDVFHPAAPGISFRNRMHCKFTAIDDHTVFIGGSNIADYYTTWSDTNMRVNGSLDGTFHQVFDFLRSFSRDHQVRLLDPADLQAGSDRLVLTLPSRRSDIRTALLNLIRSADHSIHLRTWYFLPDSEIMEALCEQAVRGLQVNVMFSNQTRVRPVDVANHIPVRRLVQAGGHVFRYTGTYLHSKVSWNNRGEVLLGSANLDAHSMHNNFESCLLINDPSLAWDLRGNFMNDLATCQPQTLESLNQRSLAGRILSQTCYLAAPLL